MKAAVLILGGIAAGVAVAAGLVLLPPAVLIGGAFLALILGIICFAAAGIISGEDTGAG